VLPRTIAIGFTLACFFLLGASASASSGNVFYVDASGGNDAHSGQSPALAWKTMAAVNAHRFLPGDHLYFHAGQEFAGMMRSAGSGTSAAPTLLGWWVKGA